MSFWPEMYVQSFKAKAEKQERRVDRKHKKMYLSICIATLADLFVYSRVENERLIPNDTVRRAVSLLWQYSLLSDELLT